MAPLMLGTTISFIFYNYIPIWFSHLWAFSQFQRVRELFCRPSTTSSNICAVPVLLSQSVNQWCLSTYNSTACSATYNSAIIRSESVAQIFTIAQGSLCVLIVLCLCWSIYLCVSLITSPVLTQSMNDIINYLLIIPICGSTGMAYYLWWIQNYSISYSWIAKFFAALSVAQVIALPLGVISGRLKSYGLLTL